MGGKKKQAHNAFYYFMMDYKKKEESKGRVFEGMNEVATIAGNIWSHISKEERKAYEVKANIAKNKVSGLKYNSLGEDINVIKKKEENARLRIEKMENDIKCTVQNGFEGNAFADHYFLIGYINYFCFHNTTKKYIPAEITIARFNLRRGIETDDIFHIMLDPGKMPIGYHLVAQKNSEETHQIPLPPHDDSIDSKSNLKEVFEDLLHYIRKYSPDSRSLLPIYVEAENTKVAENVLHNFCTENGYDEEHIKVYSLPFLYYTLRNAVHLNVSSGPAFPSITFAIEQLEVDVYDYVKGISCNYHSVTDAFPHCSLSKAIRKVYIICDNCCQDLAITLVPGRHVPQNSAAKRLVARLPSRMIVRTEPRPAPSCPTGVNAAASVTCAGFTVPDLCAEVAKVTLRRPITLSKVAIVPQDEEEDDQSGGSAARGSSSGRGECSSAADCFGSKTCVGRAWHLPDNGLGDEWPVLGQSGSLRNASRRGRGRGRVLGRM